MLLIFYRHFLEEDPYMHAEVETPLTSSNIQNELMDYIQQHPNAADTAEGIRQWWLIKRVSDYNQDMIQLSLDQLVESHSLRKIKGGNGKEIYSLNKQ